MMIIEPTNLNFHPASGSREVPRIASRIHWSHWAYDSARITIPPRAETSARTKPFYRTRSWESDRRGSRESLQPQPMMFFVMGYTYPLTVNFLPGYRIPADMTGQDEDEDEGEGRKGERRS